jgi:dTDP-4-amino-4,6-dideoxygalactose transaminase
LSRAPLYVTRPLLPPLDEFRPWLESIWHSSQVTNGGPYHDELERALAAHLGVEHLSLFANGTLALMTALKALGLGGEVITTPYSFVATTHGLRWCGLTPVFADIDPATLNLRPDAVEAAITPATRAILPVHVYGTPCDMAALGQIAARHRLALVYDAAHAFGVADAGGSLLRHGDLSVLSFHPGNRSCASDIPFMLRQAQHERSFLWSPDG